MSRGPSSPSWAAASLRKAACMLIGRSLRVAEALLPRYRRRAGRGGRPRAVIARWGRGFTAEFAEDAEEERREEFPCPSQRGGFVAGAWLRRCVCSLSPCDLDAAEGQALPVPSDVLRTGVP